MDHRAYVYVRILWLVLATGFLYVCGNYVAQQRYITAGFCPPGVVGAGPGILVYDSRWVRVGCLPLPMPPHDKLEHEPHAPSDGKMGV